MTSRKVEVPNAEHETRDIGEGFIWISAAAMLGLIGAAGLATYWLYPETRPRHTHTQALPIFPAPALQVDPAADMRRFREEQRRELESTGSMDRARGIQRIPIEEAMREVAQEGIPGWPAP